MKFVALIVAALFTGLTFSDSLDDLVIKTTVKVAENECSHRASEGDIVSVHYTGSLIEGGKVFDSSHRRNQPIDFELGGGYVIEGWEKGILGMCENESRELYIPSKMAYGARGAGGVIPPNADLLFEVTLVKVQTPGHDEL
ncbi:LAMI_0F00892g1_1 [Lachancea mirantina]|uniref:peptidylprolyl isomerase n=1 Tax=Lachancea mirantina TaxID=1230905 RepID=A0A1G4JVU1_9SACH|nr:LAMI_0F00892g1_1 [Lachancea mirantina]